MIVLFRWVLAVINKFEYDVIQSGLTKSIWQRFDPSFSYFSNWYPVSGGKTGIYSGGKKRVKFDRKNVGR